MIDREWNAFPGLRIGGDFFKAQALAVQHAFDNSLRRNDQHVPAFEVLVTHSRAVQREVPAVTAFLERSYSDSFIVGDLASGRTRRFRLQESFPVSSGAPQRGKF